MLSTKINTIFQGQREVNYAVQQLRKIFQFQNRRTKTGQNKKNYENNTDQDPDDDFCKRPRSNKNKASYKAQEIVLPKISLDKYCAKSKYTFFSFLLIAVLTRNFLFKVFHSSHGTIDK